MELHFCRQNSIVPISVWWDFFVIWLYYNAPFHAKRKGTQKKEKRKKAYMNHMIITKNKRKQVWWVWWPLLNVLKQIFWFSGYFEFFFFFLGFIFFNVMNFLRDFIFWENLKNFFYFRYVKFVEILGYFLIIGSWGAFPCWYMIFLPFW